jgi:hypothetical protein
MEYPKEQIEELKSYCSKLSALNEGGVIYFHLEALRLPAGCNPVACDALLCPATGDSNYPSRLYLAVKVSSAYDRNWNGNVRIGEKNWVAFSWKIHPGLTLVQMLNAHLTGFTRQT